MPLRWCGAGPCSTRGMERGQFPRYRVTPQVGVTSRNALPQEKQGAVPHACSRAQGHSWGATITHSLSMFPKAQGAFGYPASSIPLSSDQLVQILQQTQSLLFSHSSQRTSPPYINLFPQHPKNRLTANKEEGDLLPGVVTALYPAGTD